MSRFQGLGAKASTSLLVCLYLGLALLSAIPVYLFTSYLSGAAKRSEFALAADQAAYRLAHEVDLTLAHLRAVKGLFDGSVHVSRDEFSTFVRALRPSGAVQALEWVPRVPLAERSDIEAAAREEGMSGFEILDYGGDGAVIRAAERAEYFPVYYLESPASGSMTIGLDVGSNLVSHQALRRARARGRQAASGRIRIIVGQEEHLVFEVYEPIFELTSLDLDSRSLSLEGFVRGVFRIADLVKLAVPEEEFRVAVFDLSAPPVAAQLYPAKPLKDDERFLRDVEFPIADRLWSVRLAPAAAAAPDSLPLLATAAWLALLIVLWILRELVSSRRHGEELAEINGRLEALSDQRQQAIRELERSNRELDDFASIVSHDLKEPLRAISNHAKFLVEDYAGQLDQDGEKRLNRLIALGKRLERLIADLLHYARLGRGERQIESVDLGQAIADIEASLAELLQSRNARLVIKGPLPPVRAHRPHVTALFQNLIVNGLKYNDSEDRLIEIGHGPAGSDGQPSSFERFYVKDNGIGIDEAFKEDVFRIFKRLNSPAAYGEGTGAGLSFVKKIVESYGGKIWLTSTPGEGTTFFFTLERSDEAIAPETRLRAA